MQTWCGAVPERLALLFFSLVPTDKPNIPESEYARKITWSGSQIEKNLFQVDKFSNPNSCINSKVVSIVEKLS